MTGSSYRITTSGILVCIEHGKPSAEEWSKVLTMLQAQRANLKGILVISFGTDGPDARQRTQYKECMGSKLSIPTAVLMDSTLVRGVMTAFSWVTGQNSSRAFSHAQLKEALDFLKLDDKSRSEVEALCLPALKPSATKA